MTTRFLTILILLIGTLPAFAQELSGGASGGGAIQGGSGAPGSGVGIPGAIAIGTTATGIGATATYGVKAGSSYLAIAPAPVRRPMTAHGQRF